MTAVLLGTAVVLSAVAAEPDSSASEVEIGRRIYQEGMLPGEVALKGVRRNGTTVEGSEAACANCHRRSGMGSVEGLIQVPPITGKALFGNGDKVVATMDMRLVKAMNQTHPPYTDEALAYTLRHNVNIIGREMNVAMPSYDLGEQEMRALSTYLKQLSAKWSPGVTEDTIRFATVITPGVAPARKKILLDMMRSAFAQKNGSTVSGKQRGGRRHMVTAAEMILGTERKWELDVWELKGPPQDWGTQLDEFYRRQPVFALVSGLSNDTWEPVHDFCEREQVPCWFPSVDLPPQSTHAFYPVYFSRGVALEADVLGRHLTQASGQRPRRVVQVYRDDYVGRGAARALSDSLAGSGITVEDRVLEQGSPVALRTALQGIKAGDAVMLWLRPADLAALSHVTPPQAALYFSARLAGGEHAPFPASWKKTAQLVYLYEQPERRDANLSYFHQWLKLRKLPLVDEPLQSEIYFSLNYLTDTLAEMLDNVYRDYLMERAENMISQRESNKAEVEGWSRDMMRLPANTTIETGAVADGVGTRTAKLIGRREGTTIYPRLSLGPSQRFASKGGYIMRFANAKSDKLIAETGWVVP